MKYNFIGLDIDILDRQEALKICEDFLNKQMHKTLFFLNAHCYSVSQADSKYLQTLHNTDLLLNDGIGVKIGLKLLGINEKENMNGTDFIPQIIELAANMNKNVYLLGGKPQVAEKAAAEIKNRFPACNVVGFRDGYFSAEQNAEVIKDIIDKKTDVLVVGMGVPRQEIWIYENKEALSQLHLSIAGGAILDFLSGNAKRAPKLMRKLGLEWLHRLVRDPKRLWKRNFVSNVKFLFYVMRAKLSGKHP